MQSIPLSYAPDPLGYFQLLRHLPNFIWLDSGRPLSRQGRYDIFTADPISSARINFDGQLLIDNQRVNESDTDICFEKWLNKYSSLDKTLPADIPFVGGVIGYFGYRWQHKNFGLPLPRQEQLPIAELFAADWSLVLDHHEHRATLTCSDSQDSDKRITAILTLLESKKQPFERFSCGAFFAQTPRANYLAALNRIHEYILAGDCYQTNFSQRFSASFSGDLAAAYCLLRKATPSPYGAFIAGEGTHILCASPERFMHVDDNAVTTQPIKGTCPRGSTHEEDTAFSRALITSEKNRAENVMIVDLLRNDLSQCCEPFSVDVPELCALHTFANVHHLMSTVTGRLSPKYSAFDLFKRSFPGGSITGAPKKRSMEIINELEQNERGIYCGSIAYFSKNNRHDSNIAIRTLQADSKNLYCWGGGGIVADSNNEEEYEESIVKVKMLMDALMQQVFA